MNKKLSKAILLIFWSIFIVLGYNYLINRNTFIASLKLKSFDLLLCDRKNHIAPPNQIKDIIIVIFDENTVNNIIKRTPLTRIVHASFLRKLQTKTTKPKVVGIDLIFSGESNIQAFDIALSQALTELDNVVLANYFNNAGVKILPTALLLKAAKTTGFINMPRDYDFTIRRAYPFKFSQGEKILEYSFPLKIFSIYNEFDYKDVKYDPEVPAVRFPVIKKHINPIVIPLDPKNRTMKINYFAKMDDFKVISLWDILISKVDPKIFDKKIVLLGPTIEVFQDLHPSPFGLMPGIAINANLLLNLLSEKFLTEIPERLFLIILFVICLLMSYMAIRLTGFHSFIIFSILLIASYHLATIQIRNNLLIDFFGINLLAFICWALISVYKYISIFIENRHLKLLAITDGLTNLYVFRYFEVKLHSEIKKALRENKELSLVFFDVDHFKNFNDAYGHDAGNELLKSLSSIFKRYSRPTDTICRFGGDEFIVILSNTGMEDAVKYAEKIRTIIEKYRLNWEKKELNITLSGGISSLNNLTVKEYGYLVKSADKALYQSKALGKNRITANIS